MASVDLSRINTNVGAINMLNTLKSVNKQLSLHQTRIATGKKINEAADDAAGLTLGLKMDRQSNHLQTAMDNIGDGKNLLSVAEGGLTKVNDILGKMRIKAEQAANDTMGTDERTAIKNDLNQYASEIDDIVKSTTWNGKKLLDGLKDVNDWAGGQISLQTGVTVAETTTLSNKDLTGVAVNGLFASTYVGVTGATATGAAATASADGAFSAASVNMATGAMAGIASALSELQSGTYTLLFSVTTTGATAGGTYQLLDKDGSALQIRGASDSTSATSIGLNTFAAGLSTIDTGRGITFGLDTSKMASAGAYALKFTYTQNSASYNFTVDDSSTARSRMTAIDTAITKVAGQIQSLGALQSRLDFKTEGLATAKVNTQAAYSRLMDADMAEEQLGATRSTILQSTATTMLAQANQSGQSVMQLFR